MVVDPLFFPPNRMKLKHPKLGHTGKHFYTTAYTHQFTRVSHT